MKKSLRYIGTFISVCWDVFQDWLACVVVDFQNATRKLRRKPKQKEFEESDPYFEPYKNDHA